VTSPGCSRFNLELPPVPDQRPATEVADRVWQVVLPLGTGYVGSVNAYFFADDDGVTLVDSGVGDGVTWDAVTGELRALGYGLDRVRRVVLTHTHHDHAGLATRLAAETTLEIWAHAEDVRYFERRYLRSEDYRRALAAWLAAHGMPAEEASELVAVSEATAHTVAGGLPSVRTFEGGETLRIGEYNFTVDWTPGHTPGHICLSDPAQELIICGDHILPRVSPNVGMQPDSDVNPLAGYLESLHAIADSDLRIGLPGHGQAFEDVRPRARELWEHQVERQQRLLDILGTGAQTAYELAAHVWADARPNSWADFRGHVRRNAIATLVAHLELLRERGDITRSDEPPFRYRVR
jgi:glyoxylase-like metal-dependent hydrolase (beta-lactamase superfamily II)